MDASALYARLERDFDLPRCRDGWADFMTFDEYYAEDFRGRSMGLMLDNTDGVERVWTSVFPSARALKTILDEGSTDGLLVLHHPMHWDIRNPGGPFIQIPGQYLATLRERRISAYVMHTPLDRNGPYSTTCTLADALQIDKTADCCEYFGWPVGVIGRTDCGAVSDLADRAAALVGHRVKVWPYGDEAIADGRVALVAGGGNDADTHQEVASRGVGTFITGITARNQHSQAAHDAARRCRVNLIGLTHYSSEQFACRALCGYFAGLDLPCSFVPDEPVLEDME